MASDEQSNFATARESQRNFSFPLPNGWFQVAYCDELEAGEVKKLRYFDQDWVLFRGENGEAALLEAYCPHLGAHLGVGGEVVGNHLRCPFHHWEFDQRGKCQKVPYAKRIPPKAKVGTTPVVEKNGLIMAWWHKGGEAPSWEVPEVEEVEDDTWTDYFRKEWVVRSRNQELAENSVDPVHFRYVHRTVEIPKAEAWTEGPVLRAKLSYPIGDGEALQHGDIDISVYGMGFGVTHFRGIVDTTVVISGTPVDEEYVHQRLSFMVKKRESEEATQGLGNAFVKEISRQFSEDMPIWETKTYWEAPVLCDGDGPIAVLRKWGKQFY
jgi:3-ketosteroid 9alpha-monooxygenase subunit A